MENSFVINVSSHGNSDRIAFVMLVSLICRVERKEVLLSALLYGIAVHVRISAVLFDFSLWLRLTLRVIKFGLVSFSLFVILSFIFYNLYGNCVCV